MTTTGPFLDPIPDNLSVWSWLFGDSGATRGRRTGGFRDGKSGAQLGHEEIRNLATATSEIFSQSYGLCAADRIAIVCQNSIWYPVPLFAANQLGAVVATISHEARAGDLARQLSTVAPKVVIVDESTADRVSRACGEANISQDRVILLEGSLAGRPSLQQLLHDSETSRAPPATPAWSIPPGKSSRDECAFLMFSSGTTGAPKAVMISHFNVIAQCSQIRALIDEPLKILLACLPNSHSINGVSASATSSGPVGPRSRRTWGKDIFSPHDGIAFQKSMPGTLARPQEPAILTRMVNTNAVSKFDFSAVRQFNTGAAPLAPAVIQQLSAAFPNVRLRQAWGMTETCSCLTVTPPSLSTWEHAAKVGKAVPGTQIRAVNPATRAVVEFGQEGELEARGPQVSMGYLGNLKATKEVFSSDGWFRTGDLGRIQSDGFITIHDRIKDMIKVRGHGVAPAELEDLLLSHSRVAEAAVIGIPDEDAGELPRGYIVVKPGSGSLETVLGELHRMFEAEKPGYKRLGGGIEVVPSIPKSSSGKILRRELFRPMKASRL